MNDLVVYYIKKRVCNQSQLDKIMLRIFLLLSLFMTFYSCTNEDKVSNKGQQVESEPIEQKGVNEDDAYLVPPNSILVFDLEVLEILKKKEE